MSQKRRHSLLEAVVNTIAGFFIALIVQYYVSQAFNLGTTQAEDTIIVGIFTAASVVRNYVLRRMFNWLTIKGVI